MSLFGERVIRLGPLLHGFLDASFFCVGASLLVLHQVSSPGGLTLLIAPWYPWLLSFSRAP